MDSQLRGSAVRRESRWAGWQQGRARCSFWGRDSVLCLSQLPEASVFREPHSGSCARRQAFPTQVPLSPPSEDACDDFGFTPIIRNTLPISGPYSVTSAKSLVAT